MPTPFAARLADLRKTRGLTQAQLAEAAGITVRVLSYYENHANSAAGDLAVALAKALGVTTDELLGHGTRRTAKAAGPAAPAISREDAALWKKFQQLRALPEKDRRAVFRLVNSLVGSRDDDAA